MSNLDYIKSCFPFDFERADSFCTELYNKLSDVTSELTKINKKYEYLKRGIIYNGFKALRNMMIVDVNSIKFYNGFDAIVINFKYFSLSSGITTAEKIINLELPY